MSRRLLIILGVLVVVLAIGLELASRYWGASTACVLIVNEGDEPMEGLVASYAGTRIALGELLAG